MKKAVKKVNFGCGTNLLSSWINIDNSYNARLAKYPKLRYILFKLRLLPENFYDIPWEQIAKSLIYHDVRKKLPFEDNSIDYIYSSHLIEHLTKEEAKNFLFECFRILKKGGIIRLVTPDLFIFVQLYEKNREKTDNATDQFLENMELISNSNKSIVERLFGQGHDHRWLYDEYSLKKMLISAGFIKIEKKVYNEGDVPDIQLLDNRSSISLYMEAMKL